MKEFKMTRDFALVKLSSVAAALGLLLAACGGGNAPSGNSTDGGESDAAGGGVLPIMETWKGCDALGSLQPLQDYLGAESVANGQLINAGLGEGIDGEALTCSGIFNLATYDHAEYSDTGTAEVQMGIVPWESDEVAAENYQERLQRAEDTQASGGIEYADVQTGELSGEWDESHFWTSNDPDNGMIFINAYGRSGSWILYILLKVSPDPGLRADDEAVYPFAEEDLKTWVPDEYMAQAQGEVLAKIESEQ